MDLLPQLDKILESKGDDLLELAIVAGSDPRDFYHFADFSGVNLSDADLRGMNFFGSDFSGCKLDNIEFDQGAFNGAIVDTPYYHMVDEFRLDRQDVMNLHDAGFYFWGLFREGYLDNVVELSGLSFADFARRCEISSRTLWRARRGEILVSTTLVRIFRVIKTLQDTERLIKIEYPADARQSSWLFQPSVRVLQEPSISSLEVPASLIDKIRYDASCLR